MFALQDGGHCCSSPTAENTYKQYGESSSCAADGKGGSFANQVYKIHYNTSKLYYIEYRQGNFLDDRCGHGT